MTLAEPAAFAAWLARLRAQAWVVYCKPPFAGPAHVLAYLGHYTHRVAIANDRLVTTEPGAVRFRWRDSADGNRVKIMTLTADEFLRRFLLHVVPNGFVRIPNGFVRIRHFGLLANRTLSAKLARVRALLDQPSPPSAEAPESVRAVMLRVTGRDIDRCPVCVHGRLRCVALLPPARPRAHAPPPPGPGP